MRLLVPLLCVGCFGPAVTRRTVYLREIQQAGLGPAPSGPHAAGPILDAGRVSLEAGISAALPHEPTQTREEGAPGMLLAQEWIHGRGAVGATSWLEIGMEMQVSPAFMARPLATDLAGNELSGALVRAGPQLRFHFPVGAPLQAGVLAEADVMQLAYRHRERLTTTVTTYARKEYGDGYGDGYGSAYGTDIETTEVTTETTGGPRRVWTASARTGAMFSWRAPKGVGVVGGMLVQVVPTFYGTSASTWSCTDYTDGSHDCQSAPERPPDIGAGYVGTLFLSVGVPVADLMVVAQAWGNPIGDMDVIRGTDVGGDVTIRFTP